MKRKLHSLLHNPSPAEQKAFWSSLVGLGSLAVNRTHEIVRTASFHTTDLFWIYFDQLMCCRQLWGNLQSQVKTKPLLATLVTSHLPVQSTLPFPAPSRCPQLPLQGEPITHGAAPQGWLCRGAPWQPPTTEPILEPLPCAGNTNRVFPPLASPTQCVPNPEMGNIHILYLVTDFPICTRLATSLMRCRKLFSTWTESKREREKGEKDTPKF